MIKNCSPCQRVRGRHKRDLVCWSIHHASGFRTFPCKPLLNLPQTLLMCLHQTSSLINLGHTAWIPSLFLSYACLKWKLGIFVNLWNGSGWIDRDDKIAVPVFATRCHAPLSANTWCPYFSRCFQDYHWWWRAYLTSGFTAIYFFAYCVHYFVVKLTIQGFISTVLYFGYTFIMVFVFFLLTGNYNQPGPPLRFSLIEYFISQEGEYQKKI